MTKSRWIAPSEADVPRQPVRFLRTTLDPSSCVLDAALMDDLASLQSSQTTSKSRLVFGKTSVDEVVKVMLQKKGGLPIADTPWGHKIWVSQISILGGQGRGRVLISAVFAFTESSRRHSRAISL